MNIDDDHLLDLKTEPAQQLDNAHTFDIHLTSQHSMADPYLDKFIADHFPEANKDRKRNIKVLWYNLFAVWSYDPSRATRIHKANGSYKLNRKYNEQAITSYLMRRIVDDFLDRGLIELRSGFWCHDGAIDSHLRTSYQIKGNYKNGKWVSD